MEILINYNYFELNPKYSKEREWGCGFKIITINTISKGENVMKKMNNKGFSLVELIVVVLIMAIIAVALAPQVMKWVENSRKSTDAQNYDSIVSAANIALSNELVYKDVAGAANNIKIEATTTNANYTITNDVAHPIETQMGGTLGASWRTDIKVKASVLDSIGPNGVATAPGYEINIVKGSCAVEKTRAPYNPNS